MEPAGGEGCPSGKSRGHAAPGEDKFPSSGQKSFHISTTPSNRGRKCRSPGSMPPRKVWIPQPNWMFANWLRLMEPARGESAPLANVEVSPYRGRIWSYPRNRNPFISLQLTPLSFGQPLRSPGLVLPRTMWNPQPHWLVADWLGVMEPVGGEG